LDNSWTQLFASQCEDSNAYLNALIYDASILVDATVLTQITCKSAGYACSSSLTCCKGQCAQTLGQQICKSATLDYDRDLWTFAYSDGERRGVNGTCDQDTTPWYTPRFLSSFVSVNETSVVLVGGTVSLYSALDTFLPGRQFMDDVSKDVWIYDTSSNWTRLSDLPDAYVASGVTVIDDRILILGGTENGNEISSWLWCLGCDSSGSATTQSPEPPPSPDDDNTSSSALYKYLPWVIAGTALIFGVCVVLMYVTSFEKKIPLFLDAGVLSLSLHTHTHTSNKSNSFVSLRSTHSTHSTGTHPFLYILQNCSQMRITNFVRNFFREHRVELRIHGFYRMML